MYSNINIPQSGELRQSLRNMNAIEEDFSEHFASEKKKVAVTLWKVKVSLKTVRNSARCLRAPFAEFWIIQMDDCYYLKMLMDSMTRRLEEVVERQGASIKY